MILASCSNCCFNGLQYNTLGLSVGYCVEHRRVLRDADATTCGRHFRKDLAGPSADKNSVGHRTKFSSDWIARLSDHADMTDNPEYTDHPSETLFRDRVAGAVAEYGVDTSKIHSLAALKEHRGCRPELGWVSLGRSYVRRCAGNGGRWTSGLHMLWWMKDRIAEAPRPEVSDFRLQARISMDRQSDLAVWSLVMLRLTFVADIATHAQVAGDQIGELSQLHEEAAAEASTNVSKLMGWVRRVAKPRIDRLLPLAEYQRLADEARKAHANDPTW